MSNPDLIHPTDLAAQGLRVSRPETFANKMQPLSNARVTEPVWYVAAMESVHLFRDDGKKLGFVFGSLETDFVEDIKYLDLQIEEHANAYIRRATPEEVQMAQMRRDPKGTLKKLARTEVESELADSLEKQIMERLAGQLGVSVQDLASVRSGPKPEGTDDSGVTADGAKLAGSDALSRLRAAMGGTERIRSGTGTLIVQAAAAPPITPVSTTDIKDATK